MGKKLRVLIVEDSEQDAQFILRELRKGGYLPVSKRVETSQAMTSALKESQWDIVIADYTMPHFSAPAALKLLQKSGLDLPFIIVTGTIGEEQAAEVMRAGADDFLLKSNLKRLVPAIDRELREGEIRHQKKQAEEQYHLLADRSADVIYRLGIKTERYTFVSPSVERLLGYRVDEALLLQPKDVLTPESYRKQYESMIAAISTNKTSPETLQLEAIHKDGHLVPAEISANFIFDTLGNPAEIVGIARDITERKRAEKLIRESEEKWRSFVENAPTGVVISTPEGQVLEINKKRLEMAGYDSKEEYLNASVSERYYDPKDRERWRTLLREKGRVEGYEVQFKRKDGSLYWVSMNCTLRATETGEQQFVVITQDITDRKQTEESLKVAEQNFRNSMDDSPLGIRITTEDGELLYANKAILDMGGYRSVEELRTTPTKERYTPQSYAEHQKRMELRRLAKPVPSNYEIGIVRKDGEIRHLSVSRKEVVWNGKTQFQAIYQDITEHKKAEEQLQQATKKMEYLATFPELNPNPVIEIDLKGTISYANPAAIKRFPTLIEDGGNHPYLSGLKDNIEMLKNFAGAVIINEIKLNGVYYERAFQYLKDNGTVRIYGRDITDRKHAEGKLKRAEHNFRSSLDNLPLGVRVLNADNNTLYANQALLDIYGYPDIKELDAVPVSRRYTPETYREHEERNERRRRGEPVPANYEISIIRKDGQIRHLQIFHKGIIWDGQPQAEIIYEDISDRKHAEEELKHSVEEWQTTFDSTTDLVSIHDKDFNLIKVNRAFAQALKMKPEELIGKKCYEVIHRTNEPVPNCPHVKTMANNAPAVGQLYEPNLGIYIETSTSPIINDRGEVIGSVHVSRDFSERKRMEEQLIFADRLASIGQLASGIAHELNNPLTSVIGFLELVLEKNLPDDIKKDLTTVNKEARRTTEIVKGLLTFARKQGTQKEPVNVNEIMQGVLQLRAYQQRVSNIEVNTRLTPNLPPVTGAGAQLQQVFINIIINAEQAMIEAHGKGKFSVITEQVGGAVRISFIDDGPGISPENMRKLFTPFFTTKGVGKGTGLGLSICHGIITEHGGKIYAESELGKGATFIVELPVTKKGGLDGNSQ